MALLSAGGRGGLPVQATHAQSRDGSRLESEARSDAPADEHLAQLQTCREGIVDAKSRPEERRRWADLLLSYDTPQANAMVVELLALSDRTEVQRTLSGAIAERGRQHADRLDARFVDPLLVLLDSENDDLRSAASSALAVYQDGDVAARLHAIAADSDAPLAKRLAAIDALAANIHRRQVVGRLISLLESPAPEVDARVTAALDRVSQKPYGADAAAWNRWWEEQSRMGEEAWLADQLRVALARERRLAAEVQSCRADAERDAAALVSRLRDFQRDALRPLSPEQRESKLVEWLDDPLPVVKMAALSVIKTRIADEGKRPDGEVLAGLLRVVRTGAVAHRREALQIVQNLNDPSVAETVVDRLTEEKDPPTRLVVFQAIGKLGDHRTVGALVAEIADPASRPEYVREAALALGQIAGRTPDRDSYKASVEPLKQRYHNTPAERAALRAALLAAMAGVGDPSFTPEFLEALDDDDAELLQPAIRGLTALGETSKNARLRGLITHFDPRVRLAAIEAVAKLDREDGVVEPLLTRLHPTAEPNELVRDAAWRAFREVVGARPAQDRIRAAQRLRELPELETKYLAELIANLSATDADAQVLDELRDRLATTLEASGRYAEAVPYLHDLYEGAVARGLPDANVQGIRWLEAGLRSPGQQGIGAMVARLAETSTDESQRTQIIDAVMRYLDSPDAAADALRTRSMLMELRTVSPELLGEKWKTLLANRLARLEESDGGARAPG